MKRKHLKTILRHKRYVMIECFKVGLYWQGLVHDLSKFTPIEFWISAKYFQWKSSPIDAERIAKWYSIVRLNHKSKNKHHFHYWIDIDRGKVIPIEMPYKYALEMCCDFIGAGKAYNNVSNDKWEPFRYRNEKINKDFIHPNTIHLVDKMLMKYKDTGKLI